MPGDTHVLSSSLPDAHVLSPSVPDTHVLSPSVPDTQVLSSSVPGHGETGWCRAGSRPTCTTLADHGLVEYQVPGWFGSSPCFLAR